MNITKSRTLGLAPGPKYAFPDALKTEFGLFQTAAKDVSEAPIARPRIMRGFAELGASTYTHFDFFLRDPCLEPLKTGMLEPQLNI
jgi:hypothetical protein